MSDDKHLIRLIRLGSRKAADKLFGKYYKEIYAYIYRQCCERELALDLVQDTFVASFRGLHSYDEKKAEFRTWMYHIAANKVADYYRSKGYHQRLTVQPIDDIVNEIADDTDILDSLSEKENIKQIMKIISDYELAWMNIFQMKIFEDKTFSQISSELKLSENTVKSRYYTMIKVIRKEMLK